MSTLIFDCDGVLADTERYGHLPSFNQTFEEFGLPFRWTEEAYGRKLAIGGGKERMASMLTPDVIRAAGLPDDPEALAAEVAKWHKRKTALYTEMVAAGKLPPRPGIRRLISAAQDAGWTLAVASTSAEPSVRAILEFAIGKERADRFDLLLAGDVVPKKKPDPAIYLLALERLARPAGRGARGRGLPQRPARRRRRGPALPDDRQRLHGGGGQQRSNAGGVVAGRPRWGADARDREPQRGDTGGPHHARGSRGDPGLVTRRQEAHNLEGRRG